MQQLFAFIFRLRAFLLFLLLEGASGYLLVQNGGYQSTVYFNSANRYAAQALATTNAVNEFVGLRTVNRDLAAENQRLQQRLAQASQQQPVVQVARQSFLPDSIRYVPDTVVARRFVFRLAKVINNSTQRFKNYLTLDKGTADGIRPGMGVISATGVVGRIKSCSVHFATVISVLHTDNMVSSKIKRNNAFGSIKWLGANSAVLSLQYVPRSQSVEKGDTVITSEYNASFVPGTLVGTIGRVVLRPDGAYYDIDVAAATNFGNVGFVYVIENRLQDEQQKLEAPITQP